MMKDLLSKEEIFRIERGLPRLSDWSDDLLVPFHVRQLRDAKLLWLNRRWFLERGFDIVDKFTLNRVSAWLVNTFGYICPGIDDKAVAFTGKTKTAYADRYGSSGGTAPHGGGGRAAIYGCFQAKGVGITPLVGVNALPGHAHGCASLAEGIREAIYAEIVASEFPHGAIPVIALLDTGLYFSSPDQSERYDQNVRRAIVVRPCVLRPAHAERAALFKRSVTGYVNSQAGDVRRTRDVIRHWSLHGSDEETGEVSSLRETLRRAAEQAAFGQVHRLFSGGYFSSNLSMAGELLDFGNMHVLPNWKNARVLAHSAGFGNEMEAIDILVRSLHFYFNKYCEPGHCREDIEDLNEYAKGRYRKVFDQECLRLWGGGTLAGSEAGERIVRLMRAYFSDQQRERCRYEFGRAVGECTGGIENGWLYDAVAGVEGVDASRQTPASRIVEDVVRCLRRGFQSDPDVESRLWLSWVTALRLLRPRVGIDRGVLLQRIHDLVSHLNFAGQGDAVGITDFIRSVVDQGRAHWPRLPVGFGVLAHATCDGCSAVLCARGATEPWQLWVEGIRVGDRVCVFGSWLLLQDLGDYRTTSCGRYCSFLLFADDGVRQTERIVLRLGGHEIRIPGMSGNLSLDVAGQYGFAMRPNRS